MVIADAFKQDGIESREEAMQEEVQKQMDFFKQDIKSNGAEVFFLIARSEGKIVGTIAQSKSNDLLRMHMKTDLENVPEITTVYVLALYQGKGIGSTLFKAMLKHLRGRAVEAVCLDGGYRKSQSFWIRKIGEPDVTLKDHWGKDLHHMMWYRKMKDLEEYFMDTVFGGRITVAVICSSTLRFNSGSEKRFIFLLANRNTTGQSLWT